MMKYVSGLKWFFVSLLLTTAAYAQEEKPQLEVKFGKGVQFFAPDESFHFKFEARIQSLFQAEYDLDGGKDAFEGEALIRRARLKFSGYAFNPGIEYKMELGLSNRDIEVRGRSSDYPNLILDAYMRFKIAGGLKLRIGQFKLPGNRERVISSGDLQFVDRSIVNSKFNIDRDAGLMLENKHKLGKVVMKEFFAVSQGEGRNRLTSGKGFMYTGRVEILPFGDFSKKGDYVEGALYREESPKLALGVSYSYNDDAERTGGQLGSWLYESRDITTLNADFMLKYKRISVLGEYGKRFAFHPVTMDEAGFGTAYVYSGQGMNIQAGYMIADGWEVAGRYSTNMPDEEIEHFTDHQTDYTVALSRYIVGHKLKIQGDVTYSQLDPLVSTRNEKQYMIYRLTANLNF